MNKQNGKMTLLRLLAAASAGGVCFQIDGCFRGIANVTAGLNPCGTILNCDPTAFEFARSGIDGPGVYLDEDPFCTFPPFCTPTQDPIFGTGN